MRGPARLLAAVSVAGMLALTSAAGASAASAYTTRAQFVYALDQAMGIQPVNLAQPDFQDVPTTSPYYGYIEAAYQRGWIQGISAHVFSPDAALTRQQMAKIEVTALGDANTAQTLMTTATNFKDDATISAWARGYVVEAVRLGLVQGYPNGAFVPGAKVTPAGQASFIKQFTTVYSSTQATTQPYSISVTASPSSVSVGQMTTLSAIVKNAAGQVVPNATVTYAVSGNAIISGNSLIASQSGTYTITASAGQGVSGTATISVYGTPVALRLKAMNAIVGDGQQTTTVEAQAIDQYGNVVQNAQGSVALYYLTYQGATKIVTPTGTDVAPMALATALTDGTTATFVNGAADFTVQSGLVTGQSDTFYAVEYSTSGAPLSSPTAAQLTVTSVLGTPTSLSVTSPQYLSASLATTANLSVQVLDQAGEPLLFGSVPFTVALSGPATFGNGSTGQQEFFYTGAGSVSTTSSMTQVPIVSLRGSTGTVTATVTAANLPSKTVTLQAVVGGTPSGIKITPPANASFSEAQGATGITFGVAVVDNHGYPTVATPTLDITVERNGIVATNIRVDGYTQSSSGVLDPIAASNGKFTLTDVMSGADAGTYTVSVSSEQSGVSTASPVSFTETPGAVSHLAVAAATSVPIADPSTPVTATLEDQFDNTVPTSGTVVTFANASTNSAPGITLSATSAATVNGVATVTATAPVYVGNSYLVDVGASGLGTTVATITVANTVASTLSLSFNTVYQGGDSSGTYLHSGSTAQASDTVQITVQSLDPYGHDISSQDDIEIDFSNTGLVPTFSTGGYLTQIAGTNDWTDRLTPTGSDLITATAETSGTTGITVKDTSVSTTAAGSANFTIVAGRVWQYDVFNGSGANVSTTNQTFQSGVPEELLVTPVDQYGNPTVPTVSTTIELSDTAGGGTFSLSPGGTAITSFQLYAGQAQQVVYYTARATGTFHITAN